MNAYGHRAAEDEDAGRAAEDKGTGTAEDAGAVPVAGRAGSVAGRAGSVAGRGRTAKDKGTGTAEDAGAVPVAGRAGRATEDEGAERDHLIELRRIHQKNLYVLELQKAQYGMLEVPLHILNKIDATSAEIDRINKHIAPAASSFQQDHADIPQQHIDLTFRVAFSNLSAELEAVTVRALAAILNIPPSQIVVRKVRRGSIIFSVELPKEAAERLLALYAAEDSDIKAINLSHVELTVQGDDRNTLEQKSPEQLLQELLNKKPYE